MKSLFNQNSQIAVINVLTKLVKSKIAILIMVRWYYQMKANKIENLILIIFNYSEYTFVWRLSKFQNGHHIVYWNYTAMLLYYLYKISMVWSNLDQIWTKIWTKSMFSPNLTTVYKPKCNLLIVLHYIHFTLVDSWLINIVSLINLWNVYCVNNKIV